MTRLASWDVPGALIAGLLITADVVLRISGHDSAGFDQTIPVITALYLGGRVVVSGLHAAQTNGPPPPPVPPSPTTSGQR